MEEVGFPSSIRKLTLIGADFSGDSISIIGRLENLEVLKLIKIDFERDKWETKDGEFQKLTFLKLDSIYNLSEWNVASSEHFPRLQQLVLRECHQLQEIPSKISTLQLIKIKERCTRSLVESAKRIQQKQSEMGNEELRVITPDSWFTYNSKTSANMDFSSKSVMLDLSKQIITDERRSTYLHLFNLIIEWRRYGYIPNKEVQIQWSKLHLSIVVDYFSNFSAIYDFPELPATRSLIGILSSSERMFSEGRVAVASFTHELEQWFVVPRLNKCHETENRIKKYHLLEAFISFLLKLLHHKTDLNIDPWQDQIDNLEKELRTLFAILGDTSLMLCPDEHEEFHKLLAEFEAVANEAGYLVHSLFFSIRRTFETMNKDLGAVLNHFGLLKGDIRKFLYLLTSVRRWTPTTSVLDSLLIVDSLIHELDDLMNREDNRIADVKDQIKILHQGLMLSRSSIKNIGAPQPSEIGELKEPLMHMGDVARDAEYVIISFLVGDAPLWYLSTRLTDVNRKIELIGTELHEIAKKYKSGDLKVAKDFSSQPSLQAKSTTKVDDVIVGLEDKETDLLDQLLEGREQLQVISIYGMPGLGKTTLAKKLYNHRSVNCRFDRLSWCVVSQEYKRQSILTDILIHLKSEHGKDSILKMDEESLVGCIYKTLWKRRYLIVMDDVWDPNVWDDLWRCFPDDGNGSRILFTTRNKDVAPPNCIIYKLPFLSNDQCLELLKKKVFDNGPFPPELLGIGEKIAANCRGLPLAVVVIAGILSAVDKEKSKWERVQAKLASYIFEGGDNSLVMQMLEISYMHLPDYLKPCFLYLGAFEEDKEILVKELMRLWIAEGFIHKEEGKSAGNVAEQYLMELIDKSLVMVSKRRSDGGVKTCIIHDIFRDFCLKRSEGGDPMKFVKRGIFPIYEKSYRIRTRERDPINLHYCQHVRSLLGEGLSCTLFLHRMRSLRVLHFDNVRSGDHYIGIEYLIKLRYLVISNLPPSISSFVNLEYLCVETQEIVCLPSAVMKMRKLRYIRAAHVEYDKDCKNNSQTNILEFLSHVVIRELKDEEMLKCSPRLRKLECTYKLEKNWACTFDLRFLAQLDSLKLEFKNYPRHMNLEEIGFPSNIRKLTLNFRGFTNCEGMSKIGRLEKLEVLILIGIKFEDERWDTRDGEFQKLRFLKLDAISHLSEWNVGCREHFPQLQQLVLRNCYKLQEIPSEVGEIPMLQLIEIKQSCTKSMVESVKRIQNEQLEMGNEELRVITADIRYINESSSKEKDETTMVRRVVMI